MTAEKRCPMTVLDRRWCEVPGPGDQGRHEAW
jgi:hypothetical protein